MSSFRVKGYGPIELEYPGPLETLFQKKDLSTQDTRSGTSYPIVCACREWKAPSTLFRRRVPLRVPQRVTASRIVRKDPHVVARRRFEILTITVHMPPPETITVPAVCGEPLQGFPESAQLIRMLRPVLAYLGNQSETIRYDNRQSGLMGKPTITQIFRLAWGILSWKRSIRPCERVGEQI